MSGGQNKLYLNENGTLQNPAVWASAEFEDTRSIAWGDVDGDGDLDLAAGNGLNPNRLYLNENGQLQRKASWFSLDQDDTYEVIWADIDGDGDLDLFAANSNGPNKLYRNENGTLNPTAVWQSDPTSATGAAIGDSDNDGDLDIATSQLNLTDGSGLPNLLYQKGAPAHPLTPNQSEAIHIDLQFAGEPNSLAPAEGFATAAIRDGLIPISYTLYHPLSQPYGTVRGFYSLDGGDNWLPAERTEETQWLNLASTPYPTPTITATHVYTWDTVASGVFGQSDNVVFRLEAYPQNAPVGEHSYLNQAAQPPQRPFIATQTYPFRLRGTQVRVLSGTTPVADALVYQLPNGQTTGGTPLQDGQGTPFRTDTLGYLQGRATLAVSDTLMALMPVTTTSVSGGAMSFDGVDDYIIRNPVLSDFPQDEITVAFWMQGDGLTSTRGTPFSYATSIFDDEFLIFDYNNFSIHREFEFVSTGISANDGEWHHIAITWRGADGQAILYMDGTAVFTGTLAAGTTLDPAGSFLIGQEQDSIEGGFQDFQAFKGLMDEVEVWNRVLTGAEIADGYANENGRTGTEDGLVLYWDFDEDNGQRTLDQSGSHSHGRIESATRIGIPGGYTVYYTNAQPQETAVAAHTVSATAIQTLTVSAEKPLILFDVDLSLEWDASQDPAYLEQLEFDLQKASAYLYDFTDGQVALGEVTVSQNGDNWLFSDIVVRSTNRLRPFAIQGGIVLTPTVDPDHPDIIYTTGQVSMGSTWNRYGNPGQNLGGDWSVILAHELSHYFLYLDDNYIGLNEAGLLVPVDSCTGSAMGDPYTPNNTEFLTAAEWLPKCEQSLAHQTLERSEWETLELWYPWLRSPTAPYNAGPTLMPFGFTNVTILDPEKPGEPIIDPTFYIDYADAAVSSSEASGYLLSTAADTGNEYVVALGNPATGQNRLLARGAAVGDRLCVFDPARQQFGCETVEEGDNRLQLEHDDSWRPLIQISPVSSTTVDIQLTLDGPALPVRARLFSDLGTGTDIVTLTERTVLPDGSRFYSATITLDVPALAGHIHLWVDEPATETDPRREIIVAYGIGGNPGLARGAGGLARGAGGLARGAGGLARGAGGLARGAGGLARGAGGLARGAGAPLLSPNGQFIFFTENPADFAEGELYAIQQLAGLPPLPAGKTTLGSSYQLVASPNVTRVITGSVSFQYLGLDALNEGIDENELTIHFWNGTDWEALTTTRDSYYNLASADSAGVGIYALLAGVTEPQITALDPALVTNDNNTPLTISGADFLRPVQVEISSSQGTFTLPLAAVTATTIQATVPAGLPAAEYQLTVRNGDGGTSQQTAALAIFDPATACFYDFFDSGRSQWTVSGGWDIVQLPDGNLALTDSPAGNYLSAAPNSGNRLTMITSVPFSLAACTDPVLTFDHEFIFAAGEGHADSGRVELSADGGANWDTLASYSGGGVFGEPVIAADAPASPEWLGDEWRGGWFDLSSYSGMVQLRFVLETDEAVADKGWLLDNVFVRPRTAAAPTADLQIEASYQGAAELDAGDRAEYTLIATNNGPDVLAATVSAELPPAALGTITCSDGCLITNNTVSWAFPALFTSQTMTIAIETAASYSGTLTLTTDIAAPPSDWQDGTMGNNTATVSQPMVSIPPAAEPTADLAVTLSYDGPATITAGEPAAYTLNIINNGPDVLPVVVNFTVPSAALGRLDCANACAVTGDTVNWLLPAFTGTQPLTVSLTTADSYSGTLSTSATVSSPTEGYIEVNGNNNQVQLAGPAVMTVTPPPPEETYEVFLPLLTK